MNRLALVRPVRGTLLLAVVLQAAASALLLVPLVALVLFAGAWLDSGPTPGTSLVVAAVVGTIGSALLAAAATILSHRADADLTWHLQKRLSAAIRRLPVPVVTGHGAGRITKIVHDDTAALHYLVAHTILDATAVIVTPLAGLIALTAFDWRIALCSVAPLAAGIGFYVRAMRGSGAKFAEYAAAQQRINGAIVEYVRGLPVAKVYGGPGGARSRFQAAVTGFHDFFRSWSRSTAAVTTASWLVVAPAVTASLFLLVGAVGLDAGWMDTTALLAGVLLGPAVSAPVAAAGPRLQAVRTGLSALDSISDFLGQPRLTSGQGPPPVSGGVRFEHVTHRYADGADALTDVSFNLPETGLIGIVGASGSGKSTLAALLARFADPTAGRITLGGVDVRDLSEADLYQRIAFVFQDTALRRAGIRDILTGGRPTDEQAIVATASAAMIHHDIAALPHGYDTVLGDDSDLSGGQRQRLCLARALLHRPRVLVLDEALSAVDAGTRVALSSTLAEQARDRAVLLIAHDLATVMRADLILVLDRGRLVGTGTHAHLLDHCPAYQALWNARPQVDARGPDVAEPCTAAPGKDA